MSTRATEEFKRDRGDEYGPAVLPVVEPEVRDSIVQSAVERLMTTLAGNRNRGRGVFVHGRYRCHGFVDSAHDM